MRCEITHNVQIHLLIIEWVTLQNFSPNFASRKCLSLFPTPTCSNTHRAKDKKKVEIYTPTFTWVFWMSVLVAFLYSFSLYYCCILQLFIVEYTLHLLHLSSKNIVNLQNIIGNNLMNSQRALGIWPTPSEWISHGF